MFKMSIDIRSIFFVSTMYKIPMLITSKVSGSIVCIVYKVSRLSKMSVFILDKMLCVHNVQNVRVHAVHSVRLCVQDVRVQKELNHMRFLILLFFNTSALFHMSLWSFRFPREHTSAVSFNSLAASSVVLQLYSPSST